MVEHNSGVSVNDIREQFLAFFESKEHSRQHSAPLIPHNDPTLMFVNAGMVPFKNVFTGVEKRDYVRATSSQKCVRAGGKHNDLDNVGYTARHHTFFEMLGNFSFGDYFKEDAIKHAWEFLTSDKWLGLDPERLSITVYHTDDEAFNIWKSITNFPDEKILRIPTNDNFWAMGDTGPCGPCSEIFYDHGADKAEGEWRIDDEGNDLFGDRFIEIWNLVFMQYEQVDKETRIDLPKPSIDTGMGLERVAAVKQGVCDNYDIDLFENLIEAILSASHQMPMKDNPEIKTACKVIADHLRSTAFLLADGVMPSNEGRGYVLRRIIRRAIRYGYQTLKAESALMYRLVPALLREMGDAYPELRRAEALITEMLKLEEESFRKTLGRGLKLLDEEREKATNESIFSGEAAFKLYDTYGFPLDLTQDILRSHAMGVDIEEYNRCMEEQRARARAAWKGSGAQATEDVWFELQEQHGATEFLGYEMHNVEANIIAIIKDGAKVEAANQGDTVDLLLNQTPFYGESGGQEGDKGIISAADLEIEVTDTAKQLGSLHVHYAAIKKGSISMGQQINASVDTSRRDKLKANHSATHLLHAVLRNVLGDHVTQKGSLVAEDRLRFDISHPKAITREEILDIEAKVNELIRQNTSVGTKLMTPDDAIEEGALALFGEKYGDEVRVVDMGEQVNQSYSVELCGGTHVKHTGDIGLFKIISESAIAAGVRRIEALTGQEAIEYVTTIEDNIQNLAGLLKSKPEELEDRIEALQNDRKRLEKELSEARKSLAMGGSSDVEAEEIKGITFIGRHFDGIPPKDLRSVAEDLKKNMSSGVVAVASNFEGKASIIVAVTDDITDSYNAPELVRIGSSVAGGKGGGGKPNFAQAGGPEGSKVGDVITSIRDKISAA